MPLSGPSGRLRREPVLIERVPLVVKDPVQRAPMVARGGIGRWAYNPRGAGAALLRRHALSFRPFGKSMLSDGT